MKCVISRQLLTQIPITRHLIRTCFRAHNLISVSPNFSMAIYIDLLAGLEEVHTASLDSQITTTGVFDLEVQPSSLQIISSYSAGTYVYTI